MSNKKVVEDPLKPLDQICEPDERQQHFVGKLKDNHAALSVILLNENVPIDVRQLFETAKNLSLYSWFVYPFHQASELAALSALEMALRKRYLAENPQSKLTKYLHGLNKLMLHAKNEKWITNKGFSDLYERAKYFAKHKKNITDDFDKEPFMQVEEPSEEEIESVLLDLDLNMVDAVVDNAPKIRNDLAHGSSVLHPNSISTLVMTSKVINQVYF